MIVKEKLVSVIILYYNQPTYIFDAIKSVINQDYPLIELFIIDDYSIDIDKGKIMYYIEENKNKNIVSYKILSNNENFGTVKSINKAIKNVSGDYIKIFAADDAIASVETLSNQVKYLEESKNIAVTGKLIQCDQNLHYLFDRSVDQNNRKLPIVLKMPPLKREKYIYRYNLFPYITQAMLFSKSFFTLVGNYDENFRLIEDTPMMWRIIDSNISVGFINEYVILHRIGSGITAKSIAIKSIDYCEDCIRVLKIQQARSTNALIKMDCISQQYLFKIRCELSTAPRKKDKLILLIKSVPFVLLFAFLHPIRAGQLSRSIWQ